MEIDMNYLYEHDLRYRLAWATWRLDLDNKNHTSTLKIKNNTTSIIDVEVTDIDEDDLSPSDTQNN